MKKFFILSATILLLAVACNKTQPQAGNQPTSYDECTSMGGQLNRNPGYPQCSYNGKVFAGPPQSGVSENPNQGTTTAGQVSAPKGQTTTRDNPNGPDYFPGGQKPAGQVSEVVFGSDLLEPPYDIISGQTALDLLKIKHKVVAKTYSGIGEFVESIDGMKPDSQHFWAFYVNGKSSNVGASSYVLKSGDKIEWKLEAISSSGE